VTATRDRGLGNAIGALAGSGRLRMWELSPAAERMVLDFLLAHGNMPLWNGVARRFVRYSNYAKDPARHAELVAQLELDGVYEWVAREPGTSPPVPVADVLLMSSRTIFEFDPGVRTTAVNILADVDAGTGMFVAFMSAQWQAGHGTDTPFGDVIDAYRAATCEGTRP
jgi:hypothetical protein